MTDDQILVASVILAVFIGFALGYFAHRSKQDLTRYAGDIVIEEVADKTVYSLELNCEPEDLKEQAKVLFHVRENRK